MAALGKLDGESAGFAFGFKSGRKFRIRGNPGNFKTFRCLADKYSVIVLSDNGFAVGVNGLGDRIVGIVDFDQTDVSHTRSIVDFSR